MFSLLSPSPISERDPHPRTPRHMAFSFTLLGGFWGGLNGNQRKPTLRVPHFQRKESRSPRAHSAQGTLDGQLGYTRGVGRVWEVWHRALGSVLLFFLDGTPKMPVFFWRSLGKLQQGAPSIDCFWDLGPVFVFFWGRTKCF